MVCQEDGLNTTCSADKSSADVKYLERAHPVPAFSPPHAAAPPFRARRAPTHREHSPLSRRQSSPPRPSFILVNDKLKKVCKQCGMDAQLSCLVGAVAVVVSDADEIQGRWNVNSVLAMTNGEQRPPSN